MGMNSNRLGGLDSEHTIAPDGPRLTNQGATERAAHLCAEGAVLQCAGRHKSPVPDAVRDDVLAHR